MQDRLLEGFHTGKIKPMLDSFLQKSAELGAGVAVGRVMLEAEVPAGIGGRRAAGKDIWAASRGWKWQGSFSPTAY